MASGFRTIRKLKSPISAKDLAPLDPKHEAVEVELPLKDAEWQRLARFLKDYPTACLRVENWPDQRGKFDLDFLRHFPWLRRLQANIYWLTSLEGLAAVPRLEELRLSQTASNKLSLTPLAHCSKLKTLSINGLSKDVQALAALQHLQELKLTCVGVPDLSLLQSHPALLSLSLTYGNTTNLAALPTMPQLRELALRHVSSLQDLTPLGKCSALQSLWLQTLAHVKSLPPLAGLKKLRRIEIEGCKGIKDLRPLASAPTLEELAVFNMTHLTAKHFQPLVGHKKLCRLTAGLGVLKNNAAVKALFELPEQAGHRSQFKFRK